MSSCRNAGAAALAALALWAGGAAAAEPAANPYPGVGRAATPKEVAAWDIDVRPDFKGLPKGSGSVAKGQGVWEAKCASCHGIFGDSNEVFAPLVGGTTAADVKTGRVATLRAGDYPGRTTLMKLSSVSTLWDYINRAMPWAQPKSLATDEVYAVTAYILNMGGIVGDDFVLSDQTMGKAQARLPNRNGMTTAHSMWPGKGLRTAPQPDVRAAACMKDCDGAAGIASALPDFARNAHGNLAEQNRLVGAQHGADTANAPGAPASAPAKPAPAAGGDAAAVSGLLQKHTCVACHSLDGKLVGPGLREVARKYAGRSDAAGYLAGRIKAGSTGAWGAVPMPPQGLPEADARTIAQWLAAGAPK